MDEQSYSDRLLDKFEASVRDVESNIRDPDRYRRTAEAEGDERTAIATSQAKSRAQELLAKLIGALHRVRRTPGSENRHSVDPVTVGEMTFVPLGPRGHETLVSTPLLDPDTAYASLWNPLALPRDRVPAGHEKHLIASSTSLVGSAPPSGQLTTSESDGNRPAKW